MSDATLAALLDEDHLPAALCVFDDAPGAYRGCLRVDDVHLVMSHGAQP